MSAVIPLDELLILSYGMIVNCTYFLLKHGASVVYYTDIFVGRQNVTWLAPLPPKRHNDILEKIVWRRPLTIHMLCSDLYG